MRLFFSLALATLFLMVLAPSVDAQAPSAPRCQQVQGSTRFYWHYQCVKEEFERIQRTYPQIAKFYEIGKSVENNPIYVLEIANFEKQKNASGPRRPGFYYDATHHGNEIQGTESAMMLARKITSEYGKDPRVTRWVDELNIYINPVVNPDGNIRNQRHNVNGVDLNRNYPFQHGARASAAGPSGASEPETKANVAFMVSKDLDMYLSAHTGTWDYVVPRCSPGAFRERLRTDDEPLYEYVLAEQLRETKGMGSRGASGTGESICWAYDVIEVFSLLNEVSSEQSVPFTVRETEQLNNAQLGIYWFLDHVGRFGARLNMELGANGTKPVVQITNDGLQVATNWTFELNYKDSRRAPVIRGNQPIAPNQTITISIPTAYLQGQVHSFVRYEHLNVNPLNADPAKGRLRDPFYTWLNFTADEAKAVVRGSLGPTKADGTVADVGLLVALACVALVIARRRRA